jgi:nucleoside-diphosphate-sugar epimerase
MTGRALITGGSGFIGTTLVEHFAGRGFVVSNLDAAPPRNRAHAACWRQGDVCDSRAVHAAVEEFRPDVILHAAARTDLNGRTLEDYAANIDGVKNIIAAAERAPDIHRVVFFSSMLVCELGYIPRHDTDYRPSTMYGQSKINGEQLVRAIPTTRIPWVLVRPTSIWGPWFGAPYRNFFEAIRRGWFVLPRGHHPVRSYGHVANVAAEVVSIVAAPPTDVVGRTFYLADYVPMELAAWANSISIACGRGRIRDVPLGFLRLAALCGDAARSLGYANPPLTRFRLDNLLTSAVFDMSPVARLCPILPVSTEEGVRLTLEWLEGRESDRSAFSAGE